MRNNECIRDAALLRQRLGKDRVKIFDENGRQLHGKRLKELEALPQGAYYISSEKYHQVIRYEKLTGKSIGKLY